MSSLTPAELADRATHILADRWAYLQSERADCSSGCSVVPGDILADIRELVNSRTKTYRYVVLTQLLAKVADPSLDSRCLQARRGGQGAFDARSLCHGVVVPFDRVNDNVLGGSSEPYANNPVRVPEITAEYRGGQKDKVGWDALCRVMGAVEDAADPEFASHLLVQVLVEIMGRLEASAVTYPVPQRVSHVRFMPALNAYLAERSGGLRLQAVVAALFATMGKRFRLFAEVRSNLPTASDASTGQVADIECVDDEGHLALAVEVKDRDLTVTQVSDKLPAIRSGSVTEVLFILGSRMRRQDAAETNEILDRQFASGYNIYVFPFEDFASGVLAILGERGRHDFATEVGKVLETYHAPVSDRRAWAVLLQAL